ncbi:hypothetical protein J6590_056761 [Homalodisca vitripennis]|nr:hypothetical protein J6590_056761 [Homalodisca vitripennis]
MSTSCYRTAGRTRLFISRGSRSEAELAGSIHPASSGHPAAPHRLRFNRCRSSRSRSPDSLLLLKTNLSCFQSRDNAKARIHFTIAGESTALSASPRPCCCRSGTLESYTGWGFIPARLSFCNADTPQNIEDARTCVRFPAL